MSDLTPNPSEDIEALLASIAAAENALLPTIQEREELNQEERKHYQAYLDACAKIRAEKQRTDDAIFQARTAINRAKEKVQELQRLEQLRIAEEARAKAEAEALEREHARLIAEAAYRDRWDALTAHLPWRDDAGDSAMPHQITAGHHITENRYVIEADPMGLGKTLSAIVACDMIQAATKDTSVEYPFLGEEQRMYDGTYRIVNAIERPVGKRILYLCPASLIRNVRSEWRKWAPHRNVVFIGSMPKTSRAFALEILTEQPEYVVICNYEAWRKDGNLIDEFIKLDFDTLIIDEAHNVKNLKSNAYRGIKRLVDEHSFEYVIPMTGTPILNRPQELYALLSIILPRQFYREQDFLWDFCQQDNDTGYWYFKPGGLDRVAKKISKHFIRRTREQAGIKLPPKTVTIHELEKDEEAYPEQAKVRTQMRDYATIMIDEAQGKAISAAAQIAVFTRLRQVETWPAGIKQVIKEKHNGRWEIISETRCEVEESQKVDYVINFDTESKQWEGLVPNVIEDERIVIFSQFIPPLHELKRRIELMTKPGTHENYKCAIMTGETSNRDRDLIMKDFDNKFTPDRDNAQFDVILCHYKVGGVGMNLTAATQMIILDEEWNPGKRDQAYDRIHRIGQDKPVTVHVVRNTPTIDNWLADLIEYKEGIVDGFNNTMVSTEDFRQALEDGTI